MSFQRTRVSADRTLMSVIRTSLSLISFGFTIFQFSKTWYKAMGGSWVTEADNMVPEKDAEPQTSP